MKLAKVQTRAGAVRVAVIEGDQARLLNFAATGPQSLADLLNSASPKAAVAALLPQATAAAVTDLKFLAPVDQQEVWAAGVTYKRSQIARMEESKSGASHYGKVYSADRPELFFKGTARRIVHPGEPVRVRYDSNWSVPEPEFTLVLNPSMRIVGYTIGNDMSARDIEGENPLYLPQAKVYNQSCAVGPVIWLAEGTLDKPAVQIRLTITRGGNVVSSGETSLGQLHRDPQDLANWLGRESDFPDGAFLLTGTGIIPPDDFSLEHGDHVRIEITPIGVLENPVVKVRV
jgi:2-dehydro-3-deoxy-D-arabinonate dehydratase